MMRWGYSLLMWLAQPLLRHKLRRRGAQEPGYLHAIPERFGHYTSAPNQESDGLIWIHAVSLGETRTAALLIAALRQQLPGMRLLLTHGTATGRAEGVKLLQAGDLQSWQPWDTPGAVARFLSQFRPRIGILIETEIWPNLALACQQRGVPLVLANARMSAKSQRQAQRLSWLSRPAFGALAAVWAQTEADAQRLRALGADVQGVLGNLKFDAAPDAALLARGRAWRVAQSRPVVLLASSREGEEEALLQLLQEFKPFKAFEPGATGDTAINSIAKDVQWLIVPRHPQRFDAVAALIEGHGFALERRSAWAEAGPPTQTPTRPTLWLGDSLGEMALYYALADVALLGGSFAPLGGQNLIEAAACACPLLMGPHTFNFAQAAELALAAGAARRVDSLAQALQVLPALLEPSSPARVDMVNAAASFAQAHRGAVAKTSRAVRALLGQQGVDAV